VPGFCVAAVQDQDPEERRRGLKVKMAQLGTAILANPEGHVKALQQLQVGRAASQGCARGVRQRCAGG